MERAPKAGISWGAVAQSTASKLALDSCLKEGDLAARIDKLFTEVRQGDTTTLGMMEF